jgi:hypothetical protein
MRWIMFSADLPALDLLKYAKPGAPQALDHLFLLPFSYLPSDGYLADRSAQYGRDGHAAPHTL